jgi:SAM-dependent methyltransferase
VISDLARRILEDLLASPAAPAPPGFEEAAGRLLHARHLAAYAFALPHADGRDVVEIGTHRGYGSRLLASRARTFAGVDLAFDHALAARDEGGVRAIQADGQRLPLRDAIADVVVSFQVVEHVWSVPSFLLEIERVLRPGGMVVLSTPQSRGRLLRGQMPWNEEHLREYDEGSWGRLLTKFFGSVDLFGLFAGDAAAAIERRRVAVDPWPHYFAGPWGRPLRLIGRGVRRLMPGASRPSSEDVETVRASTDDALIREFTAGREDLDRALDLFAIVRKTGAGPPSPGAAFDPVAYWRSRLGAQPDLGGTGTIGAPLAWQRWLYRGKRRAYLKLLRRAGLDLPGKSVLDLGCGTGYFEDVWERLGAGAVSGIDVVPEAIERLRDAHPGRRYLCANLSVGEPDLSIFGRPDLITAIDVLYHIVDDDALIKALRRLTALLPKGGLFLFTDALREQETGAHVRFRSLNQWMQILPALGLACVDREPVFAINNHLTAAALDLPGPAGAVQHLLDLPVLRTMPCLANNWAVVARKAP